MHAVPESLGRDLAFRGGVSQPQIATCGLLPTPARSGRQAAGLRLKGIRSPYARRIPASTTICTDANIDPAPRAGFYYAIRQSKGSDKKMRRQCSRSSLFAALVVLAGLAIPVQPLAEILASDLRSQIRELAATHGFMVVGLERVGDDAATPVGGDLRHQIERLLEKYNYVLLHDADGSILEVRISKPKQAAPKFPNKYAIKTTRRGRHHVVEAELVGLRSARTRTSLIVDTGATAVVLPASMIEPLGFRSEDLRDGFAQTANGEIAIKRGTLTSLWIGKVVAHDVEVAFVVDSRLPETRLLGMSFLGRFRVTLDEGNDQLILTTTR